MNSLKRKSIQALKKKRLTEWGIREENCSSSTRKRALTVDWVLQKNLKDQEEKFQQIIENEGEEKVHYQMILNDLREK